jgi:hypothetical protein
MRLSQKFKKIEIELSAIVLISSFRTSVKIVLLLDWKVKMALSREAVGSLNFGLVLTSILLSSKSLKHRIKGMCCVSSLIKAFFSG